MANDLKTFSLDEARSIAISSQGLAEPRPPNGTVSISDLDRVMRRLNIVQIDSVNVLVRAQYMPFYSRLGAYPFDLLHEYAYEQRNVFEYSVHEASIIPMDHLPMVQHRMSQWKPWRRWSELMDEHPAIVDAAMEQIARSGPFRGGRY